MKKAFNYKLLTLLICASTTNALADEYGQVGVLNDIDMQLYGKLAISIFDQQNSSGYVFENESRIGFRAAKPMFDNVNVRMQIESGYVGNEGENGKLGARDTFVALNGKWGEVRFGRMLTPMYELVDWPYSNPGLGRVFDWGGDVSATYDRQSNIVRYDSPNFSGFSYELSTGRGDKDVDGSFHYGLGIHYSADLITLHGALEHNPKVKGTEIDGTGYLVGFELPLPAGFGFNAAYKYVKGPNSTDESTTIVEAEQQSLSIIAQYFSGPWGVKLGYAKNLESEIKGVRQDNADDVLSAQLMYIHNGFVPYLRVGSHTAYRSKGASNDQTLFGRIGLEYDF